VSQHVQRSDGRLCGRVRTEPKVVPAEKECSKCNEVLPASEFSPDKRSGDGLFAWCRPCKAEWMALRRKAQERFKKAAKMRYAWMAFSGPMLKARVEVLLDAAEQARATGLWQGREGLRAYRELGKMLEEFKRPLHPTAQDEEEGIVFYDADEEIFGGRAA
jgi:hypothetical protein